MMMMSMIKHLLIHLLMILLLLSQKPTSLMHLLRFLLLLLLNLPLPLPLLPDTKRPLGLAVPKIPLMNMSFELL
jgi:hypothetical protein